MFWATNRRVHGIAASVLDAAVRCRTKKMIVMDADMQHPVDKVGDISRRLNAENLVVGVRTSVREWGIVRRAISRSAAHFSYLVFKIRSKPTTNDMMSGFFGIRTADLHRIIKRDPHGFVLKGYKILLDILRMAPRRVKIGEVRYETFHDRKKGKSKLGAVQMIYVALSTLK